jgi:hypothetical protein
MTGSPTLLLDGMDPFASPGRQPGVSCCLYRDADGRLVQAPSVAQSRGVLDACAGNA